MEVDEAVPTWWRALRWQRVGIGVLGRVSEVEERVAARVEVGRSLMSTCAGGAVCIRHRDVGRDLTIASQQLLIGHLETHRGGARFQGYLRPSGIAMSVLAVLGVSFIAGVVRGGVAGWSLATVVAAFAVAMMPLTRPARRKVAARRRELLNALGELLAPEPPD